MSTCLLNIPTLDEIRAELGRRSLLHFTNYTYQQYHAERAHEHIAATLDRVVTGEVRRLMIFAPPQNGKSELASVRLPAYWLGRRSEDPVILASYGASLAESKSRQARQVVESNEFAALFGGIGTRRDSRAVDHWELAGHRGGLLAVGVGGPITGHGALLGIIDDPLENWAQAQSETVRNNIWEWYRTTFRTRIWEGGAIVLIMTRWHEDDLAGRLLAEQGPEWTVLRLPAIAETQDERDANNERMGLRKGEADPLGRDPGQALCPERFSLAELERIRRDVGSMAWASEYQGTPRAAEGNLFKRQWFEIVEAAPAQATRVRYWDKAGTAGGGARTAGVLMARSAEGLFFIEDAIKGQWSALERERVIRQTAELDKAKHGNGITIWVEQEPGSGGLESAQNTIRLLAGFSVYAERVTGDKETRAEPLAAQCEAGNVKLLRATWMREYLDELCDFPNGTYKDQVDATSGAFNKLAGAPALPFGWIKLPGEVTR